jgi:hypothetical protein
MKFTREMLKDQNLDLINYGKKKVQKSSTTICRQVVYGRTTNILVCPICQKLENCA